MEGAIPVLGSAPANKLVDESTAGIALLSHEVVLR